MLEAIVGIKHALVNGQIVLSSVYSRGQWFQKCDPGINDISITWEPVRTANFKPTLDFESGGRAQQTMA